MRFTDMNGLIARLFQYIRINEIITSQSFPIPIQRSIRSTVVILRLNPICSAMPGCILPCHNRSSWRGAHALSIKSRKTNTLFGKAFHIRSAIPFIQRLFYRISMMVCYKRNRSIHIIHNKYYNIGTVLCIHHRKASTAKDSHQASAYHSIHLVSY